MRAIWMRARAEFRAGVRPTIGLILLLGLGAGVVMTTVAGARRTDSAYPRLLVEANADDAVVVTAGPGIAQGIARVDLERVADLPQVSASVRVKILFLDAPGLIDQTSREAGPPTGVTFFPGPVVMDRPHAVAGRLPDPNRANEITVTEAAGRAYGLHVGDRFTLRPLKPGPGIRQWFATGQAPASIIAGGLRVTVVGETFSPGDTGDPYGSISLTPAFARRFDAANLVGQDAIAVQLKHGAADIPAFQRAVEVLASGGTAVVVAQSAQTKLIQRSIHLQAVALWLFAALALLAVILLLAQVVSRRIFLGATENPTLRTLGMTYEQLVATTFVQMAIVALAGGTLAVIVAIASSPLFPTGTGGSVEPDPGVRLDPVVLGLGFALTVGAAMAIAAVPALRAARLRSDPMGTASIRGRRVSFVANALARWGLPPSSVAGTRMALEAGRGRTAVPVRASMAGLAMALAALVAGFSFSAGFNRVLDTPRLSGWNWDVEVGQPFSPDNAAQLVPILSQDESIAGYSGGNGLAAPHLSNGNRHLSVDALSLEPHEGSVTPPILEGRWPATPNEIALGTRTMRALSVDIGGHVLVRLGDNSATDTVVGRTVVPDFGTAGQNPGEGAGLTLEGLRRLQPDAPEDMYVVRFKSGVDRAAAIADLATHHVVGDAGGVLGPEQVRKSFLADLRRVQGLPVLLAALLAIAAAVTLGHTLWTSIRRRRRDLAILKTLGFIKRQVSATVAWQSTAMVLVALAVGIPLGVAAGRWAWQAFADQLGIVPEPVVPAVAVVLLLPATFLAANVIAFWPGRRAARLQAAAVLRSE